MLLTRTVLIALLGLFVGCSTTQQVTLGKLNYDKRIASVAQVPDEGNSPQMDAHLATALQKEGITAKPPLPKGTRTSKDVDALVSYSDVWRWDLAMYLKNLSVNLYDASTGDLLAVGQWADSTPHGFRDAKLVIEGVISEMLNKVRGIKTAEATK